MLTIEETGNTVFRENFAERSKQRDTYMRFILFGILLASLPHLAWADLPLTVERLITDKGKIKLYLSLSYANADRQGVSSAAPISVQVSPTSFVTLLTQIGEHVDNSDIAVAALGLPYGLTAKAEVYARLSGLSSRRRSSGLGGSATSSQSGFADAWAGANYQFKKDDDGHAVLGFAEIALREKHRRRSASFKSAMLGATTYKAIDPVVFSLSGAYRFNQGRQDGAQSYQPPSLLLLKTAVNFPVFVRVTLFSSAYWTRRDGE